MKSAQVVLAAFVATFAQVSGANAEVEVITARTCTHGLHAQPPGGPFSVFVFCDDGAANNIGIVLTARGGGPGEIVLPDPRRIWIWQPTQRFWQNDEWAADVSEFLWSPSLRYLYVATNPIYGTGHLYELDLVYRTFLDLCPDCNDATITKVSSSGDSFSAKLVRGGESEMRTFPLR